MAQTFKHTTVDTFDNAPTAIAEKLLIKGDGSLCGAGERAVGVSVSSAAAAGDCFGVCVVGIAIVTAGAAVTAGDEIESDASACGIPLSTGKPNGIALDSAGSGGVFRMAIK